MRDLHAYRSLVASAVAKMAIELLPAVHARVSEERAAATYKWLARECDASADAAKRALADYVKDKGEQVAAVYCVAGWRDNAMAVELASQAQLAARCEAMSPLTCVHVYSVAPALPRDAAEVLAAEREQAGHMFTRETFARADENGGVRCGAVTKAEPWTAAAANAAVAAPASVPTAQAKAKATPKPAPSTAPKPAAAAAPKPAAAASKPPEAKPKGKGIPLGGSFAKSRMANMFKKAPPKKAPVKTAEAAPAPPPPEDSSDEEEDDGVQAKRPRKKGATIISDDEEEEEAPAYDRDDVPMAEAEEEPAAAAAPEAAASPGVKRKAAEQEADGAAGCAASGAQEQAAPRKLTKRIKRLVTDFDDEGNEVTKEVYEEVEVDEEPAPAAAAPPKAEKQQATLTDASNVNEDDGKPKPKAKPPKKAPAGQKGIMSFFKKQ